jgi:predicted acetyltransferase
MKETLRELKDSGITMSALYPFHFGFYRKLGWELAGHTVRSYMSFDEIAWARPGNGKFVALEASDWPRMNNAYETYRWLFNGASPRTTELAEKISVTPFWGPIPFILGYEEAGQITGFLTWYGGEVSGEIYKRELRVNQFVYSTPQAAEGLLAGIINLSAQFKQLRMQLPAEDPIWWMIGNPRQTRSEFVPEGMIRIVDLSALSVPRYPEWLRGEVNLSVTDKSAPWNEGTIAVAVEGGVLTIRASSQPAEAEVSIQALSQMFYGVEDASGLAAVGQLKATEPAIGLFNALWPKQRVWFSEHF